MELALFLSTVEGFIKIPPYIPHTRWEWRPPRMSRITKCLPETTGASLRCLGFYSASLGMPWKVPASNGKADKINFREGYKFWALKSSFKRAETCYPIGECVFQDPLLLVARLSFYHQVDTTWDHLRGESALSNCPPQTGLRARL